ncbi:MAG: glutathione S-transferase [Cyanobium sp. CACIAM 14]|nr:MAG: glutathione S-transferase [Cyanobium sp. CACIAM 14]
MVLPLPVLYSFRRCPFAIRARLALAAAGLRPGTGLELREVHLDRKPPELLELSAKATVPVLWLPETAGPEGGAQVLDESLAVMGWALARHDPADLLRYGGSAGAAAERSAIAGLIEENDGIFKSHLDRFKYAGRHPGTDPPAERAAAMGILRCWSRLLAVDGWLVGTRPSLADLALWPFVRQFRLADPEGFDREPGLRPLQAWLQRFLEGPALAQVMDGSWAPRRPWRSPRWLYHLALAVEWRQAQDQGSYRRSTRGRSLEEVGFIHASGAHQIEATFRRFYGDAGEVLLLTIDPGRLEAPVLWEPAPESGERFPHIHGPLPLEAVLKAEPYQPVSPAAPC